MAHFAELNQDNIVQRVLVVSNEDILDENGQESEEIGINFLENIFGHRNWKQTSYNNSFRFRYASFGFKYHEDVDGFSELQPYPSWNLNMQTLIWEPPIPRPEPDEENYFYTWDEESLTWISTSTK